MKLIEWEVNEDDYQEQSTSRKPSKNLPHPKESAQKTSRKSQSGYKT